MTTPTVADTAAQVWAWALLLTLLRIRIDELELLLQMAHDANGELQDEFAECRLLHSPPRPEVRRG